MAGLWIGCRLVVIFLFFGVVALIVVITFVFNLTIISTTLPPTSWSKILRFVHSLFNIKVLFITMAILLRSLIIITKQTALFSSLIHRMLRVVLIPTLWVCSGVLILWVAIRVGIYSTNLRSLAPVLLIPAAIPTINIHGLWVIVLLFLISELLMDASSRLLCLISVSTTLWSFLLVCRAIIILVSFRVRRYSKFSSLILESTIVVHFYWTR